MKNKVYNILKILVCLVIILDVISLLTSIMFSITTEYRSIMALDIGVCLILLFDFFRGYFTSSNRIEYVKSAWFELVVAIPFDLLLSPFLGFNYLIIFKVIRILLLIMVFFRIVGEFLSNTYLDEIVGALVLIVIGSTLGLYLIDPSMNNLFDNLWFVVVSITTVGYGDITPTSIYGKVFSLILLIIGVFIFSAITGAISSYFMDNVLKEGTYHIYELKEKVDKSETELETVNKQLKENNEKIDELKKEIDELKQVIEKNKS
ncbi:ion channel [Methanobrevibacter sp.]